MVIADDYRFLVAEDAVNRIENRVKVWGLPYPLNKTLALDYVKKLRSTLMKIKYSYLPHDMLMALEDFTVLEQLAKELASVVLPPKNVKIESTSARYAIAELRYALSILLGLRSRVALGDDNVPEYAVDIIGVEVGYAERHPKSEKLLVTKAGTEHFSLTVVTNILTIKKGEVRGVAILPPVTFFDVISEAMYCTDPLDRSFKGKRIPRDFIHRAEVVNAIEAIIRSLR